MRHGKKFNHLGVKTAHRSAMLSNMASSLIIHKRINTTVAKAKALRKYVEPILTRSKLDDTHSRRRVFSYLQDKKSVTELFNNIGQKIANRPGGYTRIIKTGARLGDNAEMCMMELVDFNELLLSGESAVKAKTKRSRRGGGKSRKEDTLKIEATEATEVKEGEVVAENSAVEVEEIVEVEETVEVKEKESDESEKPSKASSKDEENQNSEEDKKED